LLDQDCHDFNVMTRRSTCSNVSLQIVRNACEWPISSHGLFLALHGHWQLNGNYEELLAPQQGFWWSDWSLYWQLNGTHEEHLAPQQGLWWNDSSLAWKLFPQSPDATLIALNLHVQKI